jgi:hypothetical protein
LAKRDLRRKKINKKKHFTYAALAFLKYCTNLYQSQRSLQKRNKAQPAEWSPMVCKVEGTSFPSLSFIDFKLPPVPARFVGAVACGKHRQNAKEFRSINKAGLHTSNYQNLSVSRKPSGGK